MAGDKSNDGEGSRCGGFGGVAGGGAWCSLEVVPAVGWQARDSGGEKGDEIVPSILNGLTCVNANITPP
nr:hypothetical protein [Tanacetum cinerariifolium]